MIEFYKIDNNCIHITITTTSTNIKFAVTPADISYHNDRILIKQSTYTYTGIKFYDEKVVSTLKTWLDIVNNDSKMILDYQNLIEKPVAVNKEHLRDLKNALYDAEDLLRNKHKNNNNVDFLNATRVRAFVEENYIGI